MSEKDAHTLGEPLVSIAARFPTSLAAQIDVHLETMRRTVPGVTIGRSDALRSLVMHALDALYGPPPPTLFTDTVTDTDAPLSPPANARRRKRLPSVYSRRYP